MNEPVDVEALVRDWPVRNRSQIEFDGPVALDDPAETFHSASKINPSVWARWTAQTGRLEQNRRLAVGARRSGQRNLASDIVALPRPRRVEARIADVITSRRSRRQFGSGSLSLTDLATILAWGYGVTGDLPTSDEGPEQLLRSAPSGGALYPLDLFLAAKRIGGISPGLYKYDPHDHALELRAGEESAAVCAQVLTESLGPIASAHEPPLVLLITGMFWRSRFKYGLRAYRFCLLEAGHVMQNVLLAATALELAATPVGGFPDLAVEALLGVDGVNQSILYAACVGKLGESGGIARTPRGGDAASTGVC